MTDVKIVQDKILIVGVGLMVQRTSIMDKEEVTLFNSPLSKVGNILIPLISSPPSWVKVRISKTGPWFDSAHHEGRSKTHSNTMLFT